MKKYSDDFLAWIDTLMPKAEPEDDEEELIYELMKGDWDGKDTCKD